MIRKLLPLIFVLTLTAATTAQSATRYRFEMIIFEYNNPPNSQTEIPSDDPGTPDYSQSIYTIRGNAPQNSSSVIKSSQNSGIRFQLLNRGSLMLNKEASAVRRASERKQLLHTSWIQTMHDEKRAVPITIKTGKLYNTFKKQSVSKSVRFTEQGEVANTDSFSGNQFVTESSSALIPVKQYQLEGTIKVTLGRYLHVWTDLVYRQPESPVSSTGTNYENVRSYRQQDHRRMRSKELHYIDNPNYGILIYALPVK